MLQELAKEGAVATLVYLKQTGGVEMDRHGLEELMSLAKKNKDSPMGINEIA